MPNASSQRAEHGITPAASVLRCGFPADDLARGGSAALASLQPHDASQLTYPERETLLLMLLVLAHAVGIAPELGANVVGAPISPARLGQLRLARFTVRQREVLLLVIDGYPSKRIAAQLHISVRTVEMHRAAIMHRSDCTSVAALVRWALEAAVTSPDSMAPVPAESVLRSPVPPA